MTKITKRPHKGTEKNINLLELVYTIYLDFKKF